MKSYNAFRTIALTHIVLFIGLLIYLFGQIVPQYQEKMIVKWGVAVGTFGNIPLPLPTKIMLIPTSFSKSATVIMSILLLGLATVIFSHPSVKEWFLKRSPTRYYIYFILAVLFTGIVVGLFFFSMEIVLCEMITIR